MCNLEFFNISKDYKCLLKKPQMAKQPKKSSRPKINHCCRSPNIYSPLNTSIILRKVKLVDTKPYLIRPT